MTKEQFILSTIRPMAEYTFPFLSSIVGIQEPKVGEQEPKVGEHVGTGLRAMVNGRRAVLTAEHVIREALKYPSGFALSAGYGRKPFIVSGNVGLDSVRDLAIYYLPADFPYDRPGIGFWPEDRIQRTTERIDTDYLFVHGFPASRSRFLHLVEGLASRSLPYGAMQRLDVPDLQAHEFAVEFDPKGIRPADGPKGESVVDPHGLSGSPVWRIGISGRSRNEWSPELSLLVGCVTQWSPERGILIATSSTSFKELIGRH